jgi:hypothetical protein
MDTGITTPRGFPPSIRASRFSLFSISPAGPEADDLRWSTAGVADDDSEDISREVHTYSMSAIPGATARTVPDEGTFAYRGLLHRRFSVGDVIDLAFLRL